MTANQSRPTQNGGVDPEVQRHCSSAEEAPPGRKRAVPDGGWGWMCVLGSAIGHVIFGLIVRAFGVTYLALLEQFGASATATAWVGAINFSGTGFLGPVISALCRRFNCRTVTMAGGLLVAMGVLATGFAPNIYVTYITYGIITGVGLGMVYTPGYLIIGQYFDKRKALAMSMASFASGIGALVSPPLLLVLFKQYGFTGMFVVMGAVCLNACVGGAMYRPLTSPSNHRQIPDKITESKMTIAKQNSPAAREKAGKEPRATDAFVISDERAEALEKCEKCSSLPDATDAFMVIEQKSSHPNLNVSEKEESTQPLATPETNGNEKPSVTSKGFRLRYAILLGNYVFLAFAFVVFGLCFGLGLISGFLPALAVENGVSATKAAWLLSVSGISSMTSTLVLGPLLDVPAVRRHRLVVYNASNLVFGSGTLLFGFVSDYAAYVSISAVVSATAGVLMSQRVTAIADIVGSMSDAEGFGLVLMSGSFGSLLGRSLAGSIKDMFGAYTGAFYLSGSLSLLSAAIFQLSLMRRGTSKTTH